MDSLICADHAKRVTHLRAAWRVEIVQVVGGDLGHAQGFELWQVEDKFCWCFGAHGHLKLDLDTVNVRVSPVSRMVSDGTINPVVPSDSDAPRPVVTKPVGEGFSKLPYI